MATDYGQATILSPSDCFFTRDGIAADGTINQEQIVVANVEFDLLDSQRVNGSVISLRDLIKDACDNVVHFSDYMAQQLVETEIVQGDALNLWCASKSLHVGFRESGRQVVRFRSCHRHSAPVLVS